MAVKAPADIHDYLRLLEQVPEPFRRSWDAIAIYDLEGRIMAGNHVARAMVGAERALRMEGLHFTTGLTLEAATKAARDFAHCVTLGQPVETHSVFVDASGQPVPVRMRLEPARLRGQIVGVVGFARDTRQLRDVEQQFMRSEQQFRSLFENHPDALSLHDLQRRFVRVNAACERLTEYSVEELIGNTPAMLVPSGTYSVVRAHEATLRGETTEFQHRIRTKSGSMREIEGRRVPLHVDGLVRGFCVMIRDVTAERRAARSSARQAIRIAELYRIAAAAGVGADQKVAAALEAGMTALEAQFAYATRFEETGAPTIVYSAGKKPPAPADDALLQEPITVDGKPYGAIAFVRDGGAPEVVASDRDYVRALAVLVGSAIQQGERDRRLDTLAFCDVLTGLPNRALLQDRLEQTLLFARRHRRSFAAHYVDIDHFKSINDTYGHNVGDAVLVAVSAWLRSALRDSDTIGRIGGDEFVVVQPEIEAQRQAEDLAAKLCTIRDRTFRIGAHDIVVTVSIGCAVFPSDAENPVDMLKAADAALYKVKHRGRDGYALSVVN